MHLAVGTRITFQERELIGLLSSEILTLSVEDHALAKEQAYLVGYIRVNAADKITAVSHSGYELQCLEIDDKDWTFEVTVAPDQEAS